MGSTPVTRASLVTRVLQRANTSGYAEPLVEVPGLVDVALAKMHNMLVVLYEDYYMKQVNIQIVANQDTYTLPPDLMKLRQVFYQDTSGYRWPLTRIAISDLTNVPISINYSAIPTGYTMFGNSFVIYPKPYNAQTNSVLLFYTPEYAPPLNDNTPIESAVAFGWDEWVVNDCVIQIRNKAMMPAQELMAERQLLEADIKAQAKNRNSGDPPRIRDTGWGGTSPYNRWSQFAIK